MSCGMTILSVDDYLYSVKNALGITGDYQNATLREYIIEVEAFLVDAGVAQARITPGIVSRGVADLWNYGGGKGELSPYFMQRAAQLALKK